MPRRVLHLSRPEGSGGFSHVIAAAAVAGSLLGAVPVVSVSSDTTSHATPVNDEGGTRFTAGHASCAGRWDVSVLVPGIFQSSAHQNGKPTMRA